MERSPTGPGCAVFCTLLNRLPSNGQAVGQLVKMNCTAVRLPAVRSRSRTTAPSCRVTLMSGSGTGSTGP